MYYTSQVHFCDMYREHYVLHFYIMLHFQVSYQFRNCVSCYAMQSIESVGAAES